MIFDVKAIPDFFLAAKDDRLNGVNRQVRGNANFPVRQPACIGENHHGSFLFRQDSKELVKIRDVCRLLRVLAATRLCIVSYFLKYLAVTR